ncbi:MAG: MlaD family protein [Solirubrobacteraceae bacterium]|nr:MlaD family protein [Solirubrobacteraceae bacterium]
MKRLAAIAAVLIAAAALVVFATGSGDDGGYRVRAIFDNAAFVIPGMDVRIAGVVVGSIESIDVTADKKAAVVLKIDDANYQDFRQDATCTIRPQSLIGERFIECTPTKPGRAGAESPALVQVQSGVGEGQYLLPATNTARSVDLDLINNIMRLPYRQRFTILLNEFGTGLAGNGKALSAALKKSDPALKAFDDVLAILASQNTTLAELAKNGDIALQPLARERRSIQGFIQSAGETAEATAARSANLERNLQLFPPFLRELGPTMQQLGGFADAFTPVVEDLNRSAGSLNTFVTGTPAFAEASTGALTSLGETTKTAGPALEASLPLVQDVGKLTKQTKPLTANLSSLLRSFSYQDGIDNLMRTIFFVGGATNGFDQYGHYGRARLVLNICQTYSTDPGPASLSCQSNFRKDLGATTRSPAAPTGWIPPGQTAAGATAQPVSSARAATVARPPSGGSAIRLPEVLLPGDDGTTAGAGAAPKAARSGGATGGAPDAQSARSLLDYLLGQ